jgi:uncharacterized MAPEG superfamily protein
MFDNALTVGILAVIVAVVLVAFATRFVKARKSNPDDTVSNTLVRVTAVLREQLASAFALAIELKKADENGFESVKKFVIDQIMEFIEGTEYLNEFEKSLLSRQMVEQLLVPYLGHLWEYKLEMPGKNMTKATLQRLRDEKEQNEQ